MATKTKKYLNVYEAKWTTALKAAYFKSHPENCAGPDGSYPIRDASDIGDAWDLAGHAANPDEVRARIKSIAKRLGFTSGLPDTAKESLALLTESPSWMPEGLTLNPNLPFTPKARVATFKTKFLSDGAQSRNKRVYPQEAVDRLVHSGQLALETPGSDPLTCYISHGEADNDNSLKLAGKITKLWKHGGDAWANIEMPDTTTGREAAALAKFGYLKTSLRATGAELRQSKSGGMPEVSGEGLKLLGIDFTTIPGIETVTVEDVTLESSKPNNNHASQDINEVFELPTESLLLEEIQEEEIEASTSNGHDLLIANKNDLHMIHDHIAMAQGRSCAPASMSPEFAQAIIAALRATEAGRKFSQATMSQLDMAHDKAAEVLGIECSNDNMQDGDDDDTQSNQENKPSNNVEVESSNITDNQSLNILEIPQEEDDMPMTLEEAKKLLEEAGHTVQPPKSEAEKLQEIVDARIAAIQEEFNTKLEDATKKLAANVPVTKGQRQSLVEGNTAENTPVSNPKIYRKGSYLQEQLKGQDWAQLADRTQPLPDGINPAYLLQEFGHLYLMKTGYYDQD